MWPTARSGFQFFVYQDEVSLRGSCLYYMHEKLIEKDRFISKAPSMKNHLLIRKRFMLQIFLYGGYSKEVSSEKSSEKGVVHADLWSLDPRTWEWNKVCTFYN